MINLSSVLEINDYQSPKMGITSFLGVLIYHLFLKLAEDSRKAVSDFTVEEPERVQIHEFDKFPTCFLDIWAINKVDERCKIPSKYIKLPWVPGKKGRDRGSKPFFICFFLRIFVGRDALVHSAAGHLLSSRVGKLDFLLQMIIIEHLQWYWNIFWLDVTILVYYNHTNIPYTNIIIIIYIYNHTNIPIIQSS